MKSEIILQAVNISKHFSGNNALDQVNFNLCKGEVHALIGENGAGKSTFMNILSGIIKPSKGHLEIGQKQVYLTSSRHANELGISTVFQELSLVPNLTVAENIFFSRQPVNPFGVINKKALYEKTAALIRMLDIPLSPEVIVKRLSAANQQLVEILKAISLEPDILILDEPTSSLTVHEVEQLFRLMMKLKQNGTGIIYISHHLEEITAISDRVTILRDGKKIDTIQTKDTTEQDLVRLMVGRDILKIDRAKENPIRSDTPILQVKGLSVKNLFSDISFHVCKGEILGIAGLVGAGRSEVARTLFGQFMIENGEVLFEGRIVHILSPSDAIRMGLVYISEDRKHEGLYLQQSIRNNVIASNLNQVTKHGFIVEEQVDRLAKSSVSRMRVITTNIHQKVKNLSGGNQQKILLSMGLATNPKVLIVDEPTRGVDVGAKAEIYQILRELVHNGLAIIIISSDLPEVLGLSDRIMVMREGRITAAFSSQEATEQKVIAAASGI